MTSQEDKIQAVTQLLLPYSASFRDLGRIPRTKLTLDCRNAAWSELPEYPDIRTVTQARSSLVSEINAVQPGLSQEQLQAILDKYNSPRTFRVSGNACDYWSTDMVLLRLIAEDIVNTSSFGVQFKTGDPPNRLPMWFWVVLIIVIILLLIAWNRSKQSVGK